MNTPDEQTQHEALDGWGDQTVGDSTSSVSPSRTWLVGDRVRIVDGPRLLLGALGMVVEVDLPGAWPIRVYIGQRGFDRALLATHELEPADLTTP
ncbi:hypothetical protein GCM10027059_41910 [Myceligenerans halotolerans]